MPARLTASVVLKQSGGVEAEVAPAPDGREGGEADTAPPFAGAPRTPDRVPCAAPARVRALRRLARALPAGRSRPLPSRVAVFLLACHHAPRPERLQQLCGGAPALPGAAARPARQHVSAGRPAGPAVDAPRAPPAEGAGAAVRPRHGPHLPCPGGRGARA